MNVRVARSSKIQDIPPGAAFETGDFVSETLGGPPLNDSFCTMLCFRQIYLSPVEPSVVCMVLAGVPF